MDEVDEVVSKLDGFTALNPEAKQQIFLLFGILGYHQFFMMTDSVEPGSFSTLDGKIHLYLKEKGFSGCYVVQGSGFLTITPGEIILHDYSPDFGRFDEAEVEKIVRQQFPGFRVTIEKEAARRSALVDSLLRSDCPTIIPAT